MKALLPATVIFLFHLTLLEGFTVRTSNNQMRENASMLENSTQSSYHCSENCSFAISSSSLITAQESFQKFMKLKKAMLLYLNLNTINFTLKPDDQKKQNQFLEWQWTLTKNFWYLGLPIDLDYTSFHISYVGESRIRLDIKTLNSDCCVINDKIIEQIRNLLWSDVLLNKSESLLCNRYFEDQDWKRIFFFFTTVWVGYDLFCKAPNVDKAYSEKTKASYTLLIPIICFYMSLYYPLVNKLIESRPIKRHLNQIKQYLSDGMEFTDYLEGDSPFGYRRMVLKFFFWSKLRDRDRISKFLPINRMNCMYSFLFIIYLLVPMVLEIIYDKEELKDFNTIYKLGLPVFNFTEKEKIDFRKQIGISMALILCIWFANFWSCKQMSESSDYLIYFKWACRCLKTRVRCKTKPCECTDTSNLCVSCIITEDVDDVMNNIKRRGIEENNPHNSSENIDKNIKEKGADQEKFLALRIVEFIEGFEKINYYSKFIKRFSLLLSKDFWAHIWTQSTDTPTLCCCCCKRCNCQVCTMNKYKCNKGGCFKFIMGAIVIFPYNCIVILLTCAFPALWLMFFILTYRLRKMFSSKYHMKEHIDTPGNRSKSVFNPIKRTYVSGKSSDSEEQHEGLLGSNDSDNPRESPLGSNDSEDPLESPLGSNDSEDPRESPLGSNDSESHVDSNDKEDKCMISCLKNVTLIFVDVLVVFLLYLQLSIIVLIVRSAMYIVFIAVTNYEHLTKLVIVVITCAGYIGSFVYKFMDKYTSILGIMFDEVKQQNQSNSQTPSQNETQTETTPQIPSQYFITEDHFHYVIDHSFSVREEYFFVLFKAVLTILFFVVSMGILLDSNLLDTSSKLNNIIELIMVIVAPHLVLMCLEKDPNASIKEHETDIRTHTKQFRQTSESDKNKCYNCFKCVYFCDKFIGCFKGVAEVICCCEARCKKGRRRLSERDYNRR